MQLIVNWVTYLFRSTNGLVLLAMSITGLVAAILGTLSGPMAEWGVKAITVKLFGFDLQPLERVGRLVVLYHTIAMAVIAIEVYFITAIIPMKTSQRTSINATVTFGYLATMIFGLWFAYFGHNFLWHGIYLFGLSLLFFAGILLAAALNPWKKEYYVKDPEYAHTKKGVDLERVAFFTMSVATLGSALFGAAAGAFLGNGFEVFLAEAKAIDRTMPSPTIDATSSGMSPAYSKSWICGTVLSNWASTTPPRMATILLRGAGTACARRG